MHSLYSAFSDRNISRNTYYVCFVDMLQAFDTVEHYLLWYKLKRAGVRGIFLSVIQSLVIVGTSHHTPGQISCDQIIM